MIIIKSIRMFISPLSFFIRGKDSATEEAFRKDYGRLAEMFHL